MKTDKKVYGNTNEELGEMINDRLEHIRKRMILVGDDPGSLSAHGRGYAAGQVYRLIAERYFLETLLKALNT